MKRSVILLALTVLVVAVAACARRTSSVRPDGPGDRPSALAGQAIFRQNCVRCHGADGKKISNWRGTVQGMTDDQVRDQIRNGGGGMPPFKDTLSEKQVEDVAAHAEKLARS